MHRNLLRVIWFTCVVCHCWLIGVHLTEAQSQEKQHKQHTEVSCEFSLRSDPLPTPITFAGDPQAAQVTTIELTGKVPDGDTCSAELTVGESTYSFNAFGDAKVVKQKPPRRISVQLHRKSAGKYGYAFEITAADLPLKENLFVLLRTGPGRQSELLVGDPRSDDLYPGKAIKIEPRLLVVLNDQPPHEYDAVYKQHLCKKVGLCSTPFRANHSKEDRLGSIQLYGDLDGKGSLTHDMNQWGYSLSPKWVSSYSTAVGYFPQPVHFSRLDLPDPTKQDRRIYHLEFEKASELGEVSLVMLPEAIGPHRLVISQGGRPSQVLPLSISGLSLWEDLQPETQKLPAPERTALAQLSDAVAENFFYRYQIKEDHVVSVNLYRDEVSRESLAVLPRFPQLKYLSIYYGDKADAGDLASVVQKLPSLKTFRSEGIQVSDALFKAVAELPELTSFSISSHKEASPITDEQLELLSHSRSIKKLYLTAEKTTDKGLLSLADMPQLSVLDFGARQFTDKAAQEFSNRRPKCKVRINGKSYRSNPTPIK